jgi:hypothetical protein
MKEGIFILELRRWAKMIYAFPVDLYIGLCVRVQGRNTSVQRSLRPTAGDHFFLFGGVGLNPLRSLYRSPRFV